MDKLRLFLKRGYLPVQLPPAFNSDQFAAKYKIFQTAWRGIRQKPRSRPESFSVARSSYHRRITSIVNPVHFFFLASEITTYWPQIQNHFSKSRFSFSRPKLAPGIRAIRLNRFSDVHEVKFTKSAGFRYALITDVSRFFPTIYTHSIPWALHGKEVAKSRRQKTAAYFGNILDAQSMAIQDFQTIGLPIGPDTSHVIAEIIGTAIDVQLRERFARWPDGFRYVDDFYLFFNSREDAEGALSEISAAAAAFELQLNATKTRIVETRELIEESWKFKLKAVNISDNRDAQRDDIHRFFENLIALEKQTRDESVVKYGLKVISSRIIKRSNWETFEAYVLACGFAFPNTLQTVASIFATYKHYAYPVNTTALQRFCDTVIITHCRAANHNEVAWALWIMIELELRPSPSIVLAVTQMDSAVCRLLCLALLAPQLKRRQAMSKQLASYGTTDALYSSSWLLAYEGGRRRWLGNTSTSFIASDPFFVELMTNNISFFDENRRLPPIFRAKTGHDLDRLFDSDDEVDEYFDFDEADEEYFDEHGRRKSHSTDWDEDSEPTATAHDVFKGLFGTSPDDDDIDF